MPNYNLGTAHGRIDIDATGARRGTKEAKDSVETLKPSLADAAGGFGLLAASMAALSTPVMTQGILAAVGAIGGLIGGVTSLVSALAPLSGLLPAAATGFAAIAQGMQVVKLATGPVKEGFKAAEAGAKAVADAQTKLTAATAQYGAGSTQAIAAQKNLTAAQLESEKALSNLDPAARRFVTTIQAMKPEFEGLQRTAQAGLFPGVNEAITSMAPLFSSVLTPVVAATSQALGDLAADGGFMVSELGNEIKTFAMGNVPIIKALGTAFIDLMPGLVGLLTAAQPLVLWLAQLFGDMAKGISHFVRASTESGKLAAFFDKTKLAVEQILGVFGPLLTALGQIGSVAHSSGTSMLGTLGTVMARFSEWTSSLEGQTWLKDFFALAQPVMQAFGSLAVEVFKGFLEAAKLIMPILPPIFEQVKDKLLPAILELATMIDAEFISAVLDLAIAMIPLLGAFLATTPVLLALVQAVTPLIRIFAWFMNDIPIVSSVMQNLLTILSMAGLVAGALKLKSFISSMIGLKAVIAATTTKTIAGTAATTAQTTATTGQTLASKLAAAAQWLWNAAMSANPLVLLAIAIAAVVAIIIVILVKTGLLGEAWEKIKAIASAVWDGIVATFNWVKQAVGSVIDFFAKLPGKIIGFLRDAAAGVGQKLGEVITFFRELPGKIVGFLADLGRGIGEKIGEAVKWFINLPGRILEAIGDIAGKMLTLGKQIVQGMIDGIKSLAGALAGAVSDVVLGPLKAVGRFIKPGSPSKLFRYYGESVVTGMQAGLNSMRSIKMPPLTAGALELAGTGTSAFSMPNQSRASTGTGGGGGVTQTFNAPLIDFDGTFGPGTNADDIERLMRRIAKTELVSTLESVLTGVTTGTGSR